MEKNGMFHLASWLKQNAEASDWKSHSQRNICKHPENIDVASTQYMKDRKMNALPREEIKKNPPGIFNPLTSRLLSSTLLVLASD